MQWGTVKRSVCCPCSTLLETTEHLFFACLYSRKVWRSVIRLCGFENAPELWAGRKNGWEEDHSHGEALYLRRSCCLVFLCWSIWCGGSITYDVLKENKRSRMMWVCKWNSDACVNGVGWRNPVQTDSCVLTWASLWISSTRYVNHSLSCKKKLLSLISSWFGLRYIAYSLYSSGYEQWSVMIIYERTWCNSVLLPCRSLQSSVSKSCWSGIRADNW